MDTIKKIAGIGLMSLMILSSVGIGTSINKPAKAEAVNGNVTLNFDRDDGDYRIQRFNRGRRNFRGPVVVVRTDRDFFRRHNLFRRYPIFNRYLPDQIYPRRVIVSDRTNFRNAINFRNTFTGPFSINQVRVSVDRDFFLRLTDEIAVNNDVDVRVDTGNNTVSFNTRTGDIETGNARIIIGR